MNREDQEFLVKKIRAQYMEKEMTGQEDGLKKLQELDKEVKKPANTFAYVFGTISALIMGTGMSLVMAILNYPIYKRNLKSRRKKYADHIFALSDELLMK